MQYIFLLGNHGLWVGYPRWFWYFSESDLIQHLARLLPDKGAAFIAAATLTTPLQKLRRLVTSRRAFFSYYTDTGFSFIYAPCLCCWSTYTVHISSFYPVVVCWILLHRNDNNVINNMPAPLFEFSGSSCSSIRFSVYTECRILNLYERIFPTDNCPIPGDPNLVLGQPTALLSLVLLEFISSGVFIPHVIWPWMMIILTWRVTVVDT